MGEKDPSLRGDPSLTLRMMGWTPARLYTASQWAKNVGDIRSEEGPQWKLQRSGSIWQRACLR
jgi:hypothetical protein